MKPIEPFGYFKAEPFGWTDCAEKDEGATPLWDNEAMSAVENQRDELINEVEQVALALDAFFSHERGLDPYIDALYAAIQKAGAA